MERTKSKYRQLGLEIFLVSSVIGCGQFQPAPLEASPAPRTAEYPNTPKENLPSRYSHDVTTSYEDPAIEAPVVVQPVAPEGHSTERLPAPPVEEQPVQYETRPTAPATEPVVYAPPPKSVVKAPLEGPRAETRDTQRSPRASETKTNEEMFPLLWSHKRGTQAWTKFLMELLQSDGIAMTLLSGANDVADFCPAYDKLDTTRRANFWAYLISAITKYESDFDPLNRYHETTMGDDPITGKPVYSEGLLQLSYQDVQGWSFCQFDWSRDRHLDPKDPRKTILDPYKNLSCGTKILARQVARKGAIALSKGVYWSVLKINGRYSKLKEIRALTKQLPFCRG